MQVDFPKISPFIFLFLGWGWNFRQKNRQTTRSAAGRIIQNWFLVTTGSGLETILGLDVYTTDPPPGFVVMTWVVSSHHAGVSHPVLLFPWPLGYHLVTCWVGDRR